jgi:hypothetical protein
MVEELKPKKNDDVSTCAPPYDELSMSLSPLHNKKRMRLVSFLFRILIIPCSMIQRVKGKANYYYVQGDT